MRTQYSCPHHQQMTVGYLYCVLCFQRLSLARCDDFLIMIIVRIIKNWLLLGTQTSTNDVLSVPRRYQLCALRPAYWSELGTTQAGKCLAGNA
jgi:hypothetical protein